MLKEYNRKYLERLSELYPTIAKASTEIINLSSILNLPKGTEHFITDIHGEFEAFSHVLKNGSGAVRKKVTEVFGKTLSAQDIRELSTLIYYPEEKIALIRKKLTDEQLNDWYKVMLYRLIAVCRYTASKYSRSKLRKELPPDFAFVIEELITEKDDIADKEAYYEEIINTIIRINRADVFVTALAELIPKLTVDHLHILGDIYDRGSGADDIMDKLLEYHSLDVQWGNHDIVWMGAAAGQLCCIANVVRVCARYGNLATLEDGYGINLIPLVTFAMKTYGDDPCSCFRLKSDGEGDLDDIDMNMRIHKAISIIQFKLEGQLAARRPEFCLDNRAVMQMIDYENGTVTIDGRTYELLDRNFPTVLPSDPNRLSEEEEAVMERLRSAFTGCRRLQQHMQFLLNNGSFYKVYNGNLLYHGCMPLNENGEFRDVTVYGQTLKGKALYDLLDGLVRRAFFSTNEVHREEGRDILWWIWCHRDSPLFGKDKMTTFERYFIEDKATHKEHTVPYYKLIEKEETANKILKEFGLDPEIGRILNGHVPVKLIKGETPVKANGKLFIIDGGISKAYHKTTGIAGYTAILTSKHMYLAEHKPYEPLREDGTQVFHRPVMHLVHTVPERLLIRDTDNGAELREQIRNLEKLYDEFVSGGIREIY